MASRPEISRDRGTRHGRNQHWRLVVRSDMANNDQEKSSDNKIRDENQNYSSKGGGGEEEDAQMVKLSICFFYVDVWTRESFYVGISFSR